jgi:8-hydroxy-5-deazaflavin:NADPH oxidoreductase
MNDRIAIIGTGNVGASLGRRLAAAGFELRFGVRAGSEVDELLTELRSAGAKVEALAPELAVQGAKMVFLAIPAKAAVALVGELGELGEAIVVDCSNPIRWDAGPVWDPPSEGSTAQAIAAAHPKARVVKAFNGFGAEFHADPKLPQLDAGVTVFMAGDDAQAKQAVAGLAETAGFSPVDAGPLRNAGVLENAAILWIHLALAAGHGRSIALQLLRR